MSPVTIGRYGPARGGVRVYEDARRQLVTVFWRIQGRRKKKSWPLTRDGRQEARTFARALAEEWASGGRREPPTVRAVWDLYIADQGHLRQRTRVLYKARWSKYELFVGADFPADQATGLTMAQFAAALRKVGHAVGQIAAHIGQVKIVYAWAHAQKVIAHDDVAAYQFRVGKDERRGDLAEHREEELDLILAELDPRSSRTWRPHAVTQFLASQGVRINAVLNLRRSDVDFVRGRVRWRRATDKTGRDWWQPLRDGAWAALLTAFHWRLRDGYAGEYVFYSSHRRGRGDRHYQTQAWWQAFRNAEDRAELPHKDLVAAHGYRRQVTGDLWAEFGGDIKLVMDFTGHTDIRSFQKYLKSRDERLRAALAELEARERSAPETGTPPASEPVGVGVSDWEERATGRIRTVDREHVNPSEPTEQPAVAGDNPHDRGPRTPRSRGKSHPKVAPKRHPRSGGDR